MNLAALARVGRVQSRVLRLRIEWLEDANHVPSLPSRVGLVGAGAPPLGQTRGAAPKFGFEPESELGRPLWAANGRRARRRGRAEGRAEIRSPLIDAALASDWQLFACNWSRVHLVGGSAGRPAARRGGGGGCSGGGAQTQPSSSTRLARSARPSGAALSLAAEFRFRAAQVNRSWRRAASWRLCASRAEGPSMIMMMIMMMTVIIMGVECAGTWRCGGRADKEVDRWIWRRADASADKGA